MTGLLMGVGVGVSFQDGAPARSGVPVQDAGAAALIGRMAAPPDAARTALIATLIADLKSAGIWARLDGFWVLAAHNAQAAGLNWCSASMELVPMNAPVFTQDRGYQGDGAAAYLSITDADTASSRYQYMDASFGCWTLSAPAAVAGAMGRTDSRTYLIVNASASTPALAARVNNTGTSGYVEVAGVDGTGMTHACRVATASFTLRQRGLPRVTVPQTVQASRRPPTRLLAGQPAAGSAYSAVRMAAAYFGAALSDAQELAMNAALSGYLDAVGAH